MEKWGRRKIDRAFEKVGEIRKFHWFLALAVFSSVFMVGAGLFLLIKRMPFSEVPTMICFSTPIVLGLFVFLEFVRVVERNPLFSKNWEERQIRKYMEQDK